MLSAVILTKNEEKNLKACLESVSFCDEILIVDDNSLDKTKKIAKKLGGKVFTRDMNMDFSAQSNFGLEKASGDWVLFIDADERISPELREEILKALKNDRCAVYSFRRLDFIWGKWLRHGESGSNTFTRLVKKGSGKWRRRVHPYFETPDEPVLLLNPIVHFPHPDLKQFLDNVNRWSTWHAIANKEEGKRSSIFKIIFFPLAHFIKNYIFRLGFLDGMCGFVFAVVMSFHSFLAWSKLWMSHRGFTKI